VVNGHVGLMFDEVLQIYFLQFLQISIVFSLTFNSELQTARDIASTIHGKYTQDRRFTSFV
jgi:hypothetical protein